ncbi:hypothetical protein SDC9_69099 [bioreactor metagenome]|uniref:Uncharacterized protein n=1 Tax=bioreactor metagenome TaxID=1076179 RepID=A0A644Y402_9ZZZZ
MTRQEYIRRAQEAYDSGRVSDEVYDCMIRNMEVFCEDNGDDRLPRSYAEVEYDNFENAEAIDGAKFDDINYRHYVER